MKDKINRRNFLKSSAIGAAGFSLLANSSTETYAFENQTLPESVSPRRIIPLNNRWLYSEKFSPEALQVSYNDKHFERVTIPHTNKRLPMNGFDEQEYMFVSVYRRHFKLPKEFKNQRVFVDFGGVMTAAKVFLNGQQLGEYLGGYTPFSFELTDKINWNGDNVLAVEVDSTERKDIPPFGDLVDYLTFGGIYREVNLRVVNTAFIENVFAKPLNVLTENKSVNVRVFLNNAKAPNLKLNVELRDGERIIASNSQTISLDSAEINLSNLGTIELWNTDKPKLYTVRVTFSQGRIILDHYETRIGFREAKFTEKGFFLNGKVLKLRGLNRHQTFPFVGQAMPERVQKRDAWILRKELKLNIVRTSHYPQSTHFLDACDEYGLLVLEEIPGWQHIGNQDWQDLSVHYVEAMVKRDWNHPSVILWGVRINESGDNHEFYTRTNKAAHDLDDSRQTGGIRNKYDSELLEDVFTMNDFRFPLREPNHPLYIVTEHNGHMYPTKRADNVERIREHTHRHARFHNQIASSEKYAGGLAWCAFDYNTHDYFGSGDRICYHGVSDIFRIHKPAAGFYKSQCEPSEEIVIEPAFDWATGDEGDFFKEAMICSNCEKLKVYMSDGLIGEIEPERKTYPHLKYPPFVINLKPKLLEKWGVLKIEGYIGGKLVGTRKMSGKGVDKQFIVEADDKEIFANGIDMTRVVFRVADEFGNTLPFAHAAIQFTVENGEIIGENPFALVGGCGALWIKSTEKVGVIKLTAKHARLGTKIVEIRASTGKNSFNI